MNIKLQHIVPLPLKEKLLLRSSDIWNNTLVFAQGEWIKIIAPSGTGKTTLVHILYKLRQDNDGSVLFDERMLKDILDEELAMLRQQRISIVFQDLRLFPNLTARENIRLKYALHDPVYNDKIIDSMAEALGISHIIHQEAGICSYGEQQRIAIIRALIQPFDWLIMDEPFSHLDDANTAKAVELITAACRERKAGLIITDLHKDNYFPYTRELNL